MKEWTFIKYEEKGKIVVISLNNPPLNVINETMADELEQAWIRFRDDNNVWVAIITGVGERAFSAGYDIRELLDSEGKVMLSPPLRYVVPTANNVWKPTIAAINGHCCALGFWVALDCDFKIATEDADFSIPEGRLNVLPIFASLLSHYLPPPVALEILLLYEQIDARRALRLNLVNDVVPKKELMPTAMAMAEKLCQAGGPLVTRWIKELFYRGMELPFDQAWAIMKYMRELSGKLEDSNEGIKAFMQKRKPEWKAR